MSRDNEDFYLIDRILAGEKHLFAELVNHYKQYAFTIASKILLQREDAEEAAQDAFVKAFQHLPDFSRQSKFSTWLYRIVFNTAISYKRKEKKNFQSIDNSNVRYTDATPSEVEQEDKKKFITQALEKLPENERIAITLYYLKEFSMEEIASITGLQPNNVKIRIYRARLKLAKELKSILNQEALSL